MEAVNCERLSNALLCAWPHAGSWSSVNCLTSEGSKDLRVTVCLQLVIKSNMPLTFCDRDLSHCDMEPEHSEINTAYSRDNYEQTLTFLSNSGRLV